MTAPRITAEDCANAIEFTPATEEEIDSAIAYIAACWGPSHRFYRSLRTLSDRVDALRSELDRLSAQGGEVPLIDARTLKSIVDGTGSWDDAAAYMNEWLSDKIRPFTPAHPHPDTVEVPRAKLEELVKRFVELAGIVGQIKELAKIDDRHLQDAAFLRAQAQPATTTEKESS